MELAVGEVIVGKVTGITKFGAFVALEQEKTGLVHISEVSQSYVSDIREHLTEGQEVKVKVIAIDDSGRINLSIKKAQPRANNHTESSGRPHQRPMHSSSPRRSASSAQEKRERVSTPLTFEDKLKHFMQDSESRMADIRHNMDKKSGTRRRK